MYMIVASQLAGMWMLGAGTGAAVAGRVTWRSSAAAWRVAATAAVAPAATPAVAARAPITGAARAIHLYANVSRLSLRKVNGTLSNKELPGLRLLLLHDLLGESKRGNFFLFFYLAQHQIKHPSTCGPLTKSLTFKRAIPWILLVHVAPSCVSDIKLTLIFPNP